MSSPVRAQWLASQLIGCDDKNTLCIGIGHIDDSEIAAVSGPADRYSGTFTADTVFSRVAQNLVDFVFVNSMIVNMGRARFWIDEKAKFHADGLIR